MESPTDIMQAILHQLLEEFCADSNCFPEFACLNCVACTLAKYYWVPEYFDLYVLFDVVLIAMPPPNNEHGTIVQHFMNRSTVYLAHIEPRIEIHLISGVHCGRSSTLIPDLVFRQGAQTRMVVEATSRSTRNRDLDEKVRFYLSSDANEYLILDRHSVPMRFIHYSRPNWIPTVYTDSFSH